jgi:acyl-CoA reductase-like NAD-dependent aldehyde dehydrogenase
MAPWNYPILMVLLPLITMMAAGKFLNDFTEFRKN